MSTTKIPESKGDDWNDIAKEYKTYTTGPGTAASKILLERLNATVPFSKASSILDIGCGPGPVTSMLIETYGSQLPPDCTLIAGDFSEGMVAQVQASKDAATKEGNQIWPRVHAKVMNAMDLQGVTNESQSHITAGWVFMLTPDPRKCLSEALRVLRPDGALACTSWASNQWMEIMQATKTVRPGMAMPELPAAWREVEAMKKELEEAGFKNVRSEEVPVSMSFVKREMLVDFFTTKVPIVVQQTKDFTDEERRLLKEAAMKKCEELCPCEPGLLHGTALLAVGTK